MVPATLLSYYPTYKILDEILARGNYDTLNIYIDLKNNLQTLYMEHAVVGIVESSMQAKRYDTTIVHALLSFISFHKTYAFKRGIKLNIFVFFETGKSTYHKNIRKKYKIRRSIDDLYGLDANKRQLFTEVLHRNFQFIEKLFNRLPNVKVIRHQNLEADFVPYFLLTRNLVDRSPNVAHVTYSNDHDLYQNILDENTFCFVKNKKYRNIVSQGKVTSTYLKKNVDLPDEYLPFLMAIIGDSGDDVDGVKGIGPAKGEIIIEEFINLCGGHPNIIYQKIINNEPIFSNDVKIKNKYMRKVYEEEQKNKLISDNLKLVSFELISREFESPSSTEMIKRRDNFFNFFNNPKPVIPSKVLTEGLNNLRIYIESEDIIKSLYWDIKRG